MSTQHHFTIIDLISNTGSLLVTSSIVLTQVYLLIRSKGEIVNPRLGKYILYPMYRLFLVIIMIFQIAQTLISCSIWFLNVTFWGNYELLGYLISWLSSLLDFTLGFFLIQHTGNFMKSIDTFSWMEGDFEISFIWVNRLLLQSIPSSLCVH